MCGENEGGPFTSRALGSYNNNDKKGFFPNEDLGCFQNNFGTENRNAKILQSL